MKSENHIVKLPLHIDILLLKIKKHFVKKQENKNTLKEDEVFFSSFFIKCSWFTILYSFQLNSMVIRYFHTLHTIQSYHNIISDAPCAMYYIPVAYLFHNW